MAGIPGRGAMVIPAKRAQRVRAGIYNHRA
jgi:hypothetical protein